MSFVGTSNTYDQNVGIKLDFEDLIHMLDPNDLPLQNGVDGNGLSVLSVEPVTAKKVEWQDEESLNTRSNLAAAIIAGATTLTVTTGDGARFQDDDLIRIDDEVLRVVSVATDTLTVARAWAGTDAAHAINADVIGVGSAPVEGADAVAARNTKRTGRHNLTQIFGPYQVAVSGSDMAVAKYGIATNEFDHQVAGRISELGVDFEQALIYGERVDDTGTNRRSMGGMTFYITTNVDSTTTTLTEDAYLDQLQAIYDAGGNPGVSLAGAKQKRIMSSFVSTGTVEVTRSDMTAGRKITEYISDFGNVALVLNRWLNVADVFTYDRDQATIGVLRPTHFKPLAEGGDASKGQILCEKTLRFRRERHAGRFSALT